MPGSFKSRGVKPQQGGKWEPIPKGRYLVRIMNAEQGVSKAGNDKVTISVKVLENIDANIAPQKGRDIKFHTITFLSPDENGVAPKGAGMAIHFLKCIGEPWQEAENLEWDEGRWLGKRFIAEVDVDWMRGFDGKPKLNEAGEQTARNIIRYVHPGPDANPEDWPAESAAPAKAAASPAWPSPAADPVKSAPKSEDYVPF